jgi:hypothetical protein
VELGHALVNWNPVAIRYLLGIAWGTEMPGKLHESSEQDDGAWLCGDRQYHLTNYLSLSTFPIYLLFIFGSYTFSAMLWL